MGEIKNFQNYELKTHVWKVKISQIRPNKKINLCVLGNRSEILGRVGKHIFF